MARETRYTTCNRDCPDACGIRAVVEDGRILSMEGDSEHPVTRQFLCFRTSKFPEKLDAPERVRTPLLRRAKGAPLEPVSWDDALAYAADRLLSIRGESGPAAIFHYRSGGSLGLLKGLADRLFEAFGPCTTKIGDICSGAGEGAQELDLGTSDSNDLFDLLNARTIVLWGKNPTISSTHLVPVLKQAKDVGATVWSIDPVHHQGARLADRNVCPAPGRDPELILAILADLWTRHGFDPRTAERCNGLEGFEGLLDAVSVDECARVADVSVDVVRTLADAFAEGPAAILVGWGMQRRRRGGVTVRLLDALSAVSGNLYRSGGGCSFYFKRRGAFASLAVGPAAAPRTIREPLLGPDVLAARDPKIRAMWITAGNPVCMLPDSARVAEAIEKTEFVVVVDPFLTDTGRRADLVLPVATLLEDDDILGSYGHHWLGESRPLIDPPEGVRQEIDVLQDLARRIGVESAVAGSTDSWKRWLLAPATEKGLTLESLREQRRVRNPLAKQVLFGEGKVATPDGKVNLVQQVDAGAERPDDRALWLFSNSSREAQGAQWARGPGDRLAVRIHPDAAPEGVVDGSAVILRNAVGRELPALAKFDSSQRRDVAIVPKGGHFDRGLSANALVDAAATDIGYGAAYLDCHVWIVPDQQ